ncbi:MAG: FkbM family methyltransferase [Chitinophagaceae bacterium]|nr:FkbM family methyltransferase [Chitinophagaceae bacterium]
MKRRIQSFLQKLLGYDNYLFYFARAKLSFLKGDTYEPEFFEFLDIIPQGTLLDIGANIGITSVPMAKKFPDERVYAFEPMPANNNAIKRIIKFYKLNNVQLHEVALGEETGVLKMVTPVINGVRMQGLSHAYVEGLKDEWNDGDIYQIPVLRLDDVPALKEEKKITGVKIDVENFEYYVLKGGLQLLQQHKPIIYCELWPNEKRSIVIELLAGLGYVTKTFINGQLTDFTNQKTNNFIFIPTRE